MTSFENTYQQYYRQLFAIAAKIIDSKDEIEDIIQEVFIFYYTNTEIKKKVIIQPYSWLVRVTLNKCIDQSKRDKKHVNLNLLPDIGYSNEEDLEQSNRYLTLRKAMRKLPEQELKILVLYSNSFSYREIAEIMGIKYNSVGKKLSRTLQKLKLILKQMNHEMFE